MVIGEGPGEAEDKSGRAFSGKTGQLLDKMLNAISLDRKFNCYVTHVVKCRPPMNRTPMSDEISSCSGFLQAQIHILKPKILLLMGRTAYQNLLDTQSGIRDMRGKWLSWNGIPVMVTWNPHDLIEDESLKASAWHDLKMIRQKLNEEFPGYEKTVQK